MQKRVQLQSTAVNEDESQIINQKFLELLRSKESASEHESAYQYAFTDDQVQNFKHRFQQICPNELMNYEEFRHSLGLLGREESFISRIFYLIDEDKDGYIDQQNFLNYLNIIVNGSAFEKARFGWMLLTGGKGDLNLEDFHEIFQEMSVVWSALTGEPIIPKRKYV